MKNHVTDLLPWYVNGRLSMQDVERVTLHLERCAHCSSELGLQQKIHAAINAPTKVEIAPQPSFNKLWDRIVAEEFGDRPTVSQPATTTERLVTWRLQNLVERVRAYWMPFMLVTQTAAIAVLVGVVVQRTSVSSSASNEYRTVTSAPALNGTIIHVVFDDATRLADVKDILLRSSLQVASGPSTAGVYSLTPVNKAANINVQDTIKTLRDDPRVRFAELSHE